jgi:hypothetical protein
MQKSVLETSLVVDYMAQIRMWNFKIFTRKLGSEVEIWWKSVFCGYIFLNNFLMLSIFLRQIYIFWKLTIGCQVTENNKKYRQFLQLLRFLQKTMEKQYQSKPVNAKASLMPKFQPKNIFQNLTSSGDLEENVRF